jgi:hypothetical protein
LPATFKEIYAMSTKFEQLLDYLVNEEHDKANELFHEIVVEKSRSIYENLIAEEEEEDMDESADDEEMDESKEEDDEEMDESKEEDMDESADDEEMDEAEEDLEDSYMMDGDDGFSGGAEGDATDDFGKEIGAEHGDDEFEKSEDDAILDIKNAIQELEAAFAELEQTQGAEEHSMGMDGDEETDEEMMGMPMEGKRYVREYTHPVGNDWDKNSQKAQGKLAGAGTGEAVSAPKEGTSPTSSGSGKPTSGANAANIVGKTSEKTDGQHNVGTTPNKVNKGITPEKGEQYTGKDWEANSSLNGKAGVKNLSKVGDAKGLAGATKNNGSEGTAVGAGTGQNNVKGATNTKSIVDRKIG